MPERIYNVNPDGGLEPMVEQPFALEDDLQDCSRSTPSCWTGSRCAPITLGGGYLSPAKWASLSGRRRVPAGRSTTSSLTRTPCPRWWRSNAAPIPRSAEQSSANCWSTPLTHRRPGPLTRCVNASRRLAKNFGDDPTASLARLLQTDDADVDAFFQDVATNLAARRMRLLFVADEIPDPLLRIVEFLNQQMPTIEVLAVEIKQYSGTARRTLVPRVMGRIAGTSPDPRPPRLTRESFLNAFPDAAQGEVAAHLLKVAEDAGASLTWGSNSVSIRVSCAHCGDSS